MAVSTINFNTVQTPGETLTIPAPTGGSTKGQVREIGALLGVELVTEATAGDSVEYRRPAVGEVVRCAKATGFVPALGDVAFFDLGSDQRLESWAPTGNLIPIGFYAASALTGDTFARVVFDPAAAEASLHAERIPLRLLANDVQNVYLVAPFACKVVGISYYTTAKPSSASGTVLLTSKNVGVSDNALFSSLDLEGITDNALTAVTLTATAADLVLARGGMVEFLATSNNADLAVGDGVDIFVWLQRNTTPA